MFLGSLPRFSALTLAGLATLALAGCVDSRGGSIPYDTQLAPPDPPSMQALDSNYRIAPLDELSIKVYKGDEISGDYDVDLAGHISLPLVGEVEAVNMTTAQLDDRLTNLLGQKYFEHPDVSVAIKKSTAHVVTVDGAVNQSGQFPVTGSMSLIQAIALAKGTRDDANARRVAVFRTVNGQRQGAAFDLTSIRRGQAPDPKIYAGDIIVVDGSSIKAIEKQVLQLWPLAGIFGPL